MKTETPANELERRKFVRLRIRADLEIAPQKYEGRTYYVVKDPVSLRYYRFKEQEHFLIRYMDGTHTLDEAQKEFEKRFRPDRLTLEDLEQFGQQLLTAGLAQNESPNAGKQLYDRRKKRVRSEWMQTLTNILYIKIPVFDPDKLLTKMLPWTRWMFTSWFLLLSFCFMLSAGLLVLTHFQTFQSRLPSYHEFFSFKTVVYLWVALGVVKVIHEFGHGLSCKAFGGEVHEMGFLFLCFSPCMYCNVSDAWTLPNKWHRIIISGAGIYVELMIAAAATFVWWNTPHQPFVNYMSLALMVVCSVSTVMFNGNPLMRYDGYYVLADWIEIPNLRDRANRYLKRIFQEYCLGMETQPEPYMELGRRFLFVIFAIVSYVYRWVITFVILKFMATFLKPYKLEVISNMLAVAALASMVGWPLFRLGQNLNKRGRIPDMKPVRVTCTVAVAAVIVAVFFFLPLPISRVRESGVIQVQPAHIQKVPVLIPGRLEKMPVQEGQYVKKGDVIAEFSSRALAEEKIKLDLQFRKSSKQIDEYRALLNKIGNSSPDDRKELEEKLNKAEQERNDASKKLRLNEFHQGKLILVAPRDGVVMGLPTIDEVFKTWTEQDVQTKPFCSIGDPNKVRMLVPVQPGDYELIRDDLKRKKARGEPLEVTIRIQGFDANTWSGKVTHLPESIDKKVPLALTNKGGGPLAAKQQQSSQDPNQVEVQTPVYLVGIDIDNPGRAIRPGSVGQVKVHCEYRTCAWWVWRTISATFDLGLM
jgi:putative peptide zinc metalloprotease protein